MKQIVLCICFIFTLGVKLNAQNLSIDVKVSHPDPDYKTVTISDGIHTVQGAGADYSFILENLDNVDEVKNCQYTYNGEVKDLPFELNEGKLTINSISKSNLSFNTEPNKLSVLLEIKKSDKEDYESLSATAEDVWVHTEPTYELTEEPSQLIYKESTPDLKWELVANGGGTWTYDWKTSSGQTGTLNAFTVPAISEVGKATISVTAKNIAPDNKTIWKSYSNTWEVVVYEKPSVALDVPENDISSVKEFFQNMTWNLKATPQGGYQSGWTYEWKDADSGKKLGESSTYNFGNALTEDIVNRHITLTVKNTAPIKEGETAEWFSKTYNYYANFYPLPVIEFSSTYPVNVIDGETVSMGFTIKDKQGNDIKSNPHYTWSYKWTEGSKQGATDSYTYTADNSSVYQGKESIVTLTVAGTLNGIETPYTTELTHSFVSWPTPDVSLVVPVNTGETVKEFFQNTTWDLSATPQGGYQSGWTYEWKDADSGKKLGESSTYNFGNALTEDIVNRHITLTVKNTAPIKEGETAEWFSKTYDYYANFYPLPVIEFSSTYPVNVVDGETVSMGFTIKDKQGKDIKSNPHYTWSYKWTEGSKQGATDTYTYTADNSSVYQGKESIVTLTVAGTLNGIETPYTTELTHSFVSWPTPDVSLVVPVNTGETVKEFFQNMTWYLEATPQGGYQSGWTYEWKDADSSDVLGEESTYAFGNALTEDIVNRHITLTVKNTAPIKEGETAEWFSKTYDYYANFYPLPVIEFSSTYPVNVIDGETVSMGFTIKDKHGKDIKSNPHYTWSYKWTEGSKQGNTDSYIYTAANPTVYQGKEIPVTLTVSGLLNGSTTPYMTDCTHSFIVWPRQNLRDLSEHEQEKVMCGGQPLELSVNATGGLITGWTYIWKKNGEVIPVETKNTMNTILVNAPTNNARRDQYSVTAVNRWENNEWSETFNYSILIYPEPYMSTSVSLVDTNRGVNIDNGIREGNQIHYISDCYGGYPSGWRYAWSLDGRVISNDKEATLAISSGLSGDTKNSKEINLLCSIDNVYEPLIWASKQYSKTFTVYKKPQTPLSITKKGSGESGTVIATTNISDSDLEAHDYYLVFGYRDGNGVMHDESSLHQQNPGAVRWSTQIPTSVINNSSNTLYVYSLWKYPNGVEITSGLRTLNYVNEEWDDSNYSGRTRAVISQFVTDVNNVQLKDSQSDVTESYSVNGVKSTRMHKGFNVVRMGDGSFKKVIVK